MPAPSRPRWREWADASSARHLVLRLRRRLDTARACASSRRFPADDGRLRHVAGTSQTFPSTLPRQLPADARLQRRNRRCADGHAPSSPASQALTRHSPAHTSRTLSRHAAHPRRPQPCVGRGAPQRRHFLDTSQTGPRHFLGREPLYPAWPPARAALGASLPRRLLPRRRQARRPRPPLCHHGLSLPV